MCMCEPSHVQNSRKRIKQIGGIVKVKYDTVTHKAEKIFNHKKMIVLVTLSSYGSLRPSN